MNCPATENLIKHIAEFPKIKRIYYDAPEHQEFLTALLMACKAALPELRGLVMNRQEKPKVEIVMPPTTKLTAAPYPSDLRITKEDFEQQAVKEAEMTTIIDALGPDGTPRPDPVAMGRKAAAKLRGKR